MDRMEAGAWPGTWAVVASKGGCAVGGLWAGPWEKEVAVGDPSDDSSRAAGLAAGLAAA